MRSVGPLWLAAALVGCLLQLAFACDEDKGRADHYPERERTQAENRTVILSVVMTNHGFVRDARVVSGPVALQSVALKLVNRKQYKGKAIDQWGTAPAGPSSRQLLLAVTFAKQKEIPLKIQQAMPAGVSSCAIVSRVRVSPEFMACY